MAEIHPYGEPSEVLDGPLKGWTTWGDGAYPVVGGYDADDRLVAVHIDFLIIEGELPEA